MAIPKAFDYIIARSENAFSNFKTIGKYANNNEA